MNKVKVKGAVIPNDFAEVYDLLGYDYVTPKQVENTLENAAGDVEVDIASGGGSVSDASEIYTMLRNYSGKVVVNIQGLAASAASVIAMAGDEVNMSPTAQMMIHKASASAEGNADDFAQDSKMLDVIDQSIVNAYEIKTGMSRDDILQLMAKTTWLTAQDAVDKGFADNISVGSNQPLVTNAVGVPILSNSTVNKVKELLAKVRSTKPEKRVEKPVHNEKKSVSVRNQKLAILLGKKDK